MLFWKCKHFWGGGTDTWSLAKAGYLSVILGWPSQRQSNSLIVTFYISTRKKHLRWPGLCDWLLLQSAWNNAWIPAWGSRDEACKTLTWVKLLNHHLNNNSQSLSPLKVNILQTVSLKSLSTKFIIFGCFRQIFSVVQFCLATFPTQRQKHITGAFRNSCRKMELIKHL